MIRFSRFEVLQLAPKCLTLRWAVENIPAGYSEYITVLRAEAASGPWEPIVRELTAREYFHDHDANIYRPDVTVYYKLEGIVRQDEDPLHPGAPRDEQPIKPSGAAFLQYKPDAKANEIIRRQNLLLSGYNGIPGYFLIKRTWGSKCVMCYDPDLDKTLTSDCSVCFNTKYSGGYYQPMPGYCSADNTGRSEQLFEDGIKASDSKLQLWTTNTPELKKGDVWSDAQGKRWAVENIVLRTTRLRSVLRQVFIAVEIPAGDVIYKVPVPSVFELRRDRDYHVWTAKDRIL